MSKGESVLKILGSGISATSAIGMSYFGIMSADIFSQQLTSVGLEEWGEASSSLSNEVLDAADGNVFAVTTVGGLLSLISGSSSAEPDVIEVFTQNSKPCSVVERRAKKVYDQYDKNHIKALDNGASLITIDPEVAKIVDDIISNTTSKEELLNNLEALKTILSQEDNVNEKTNVKVKSINKKNKI